jgi:general secretion pathway protein E
LAQRLVRRPCYECAKPRVPTDSELVELGIDINAFRSGTLNYPNVKGMRPPPVGTVFKAVGCRACNDLGYRGRTGIYELLMISEEVRRLCLDKADAGAIRNAGIANGMVTLRIDGARKVVHGITTPEEVLLMTAEASD